MNALRKALLSLPLLLLAAGALAATLTVLVQETAVRKRPQFYAPSLAKVKAGDKLEAVALKGGWYKVTLEEEQVGFIHQSAVTAKKVRLTSGKGIGAGAATAEEITLAGKGFNASVEKDYRGEHAEADFKAVDEMENSRLSDEALLKFMSWGGLLPSKEKP
ncbi:MAG TPA: hypothetical protein DCM05_18105 [Elusimicrobia bacterium]|nr:hypothetical protein [Elusimicrobiota bacterium]